MDASGATKAETNSDLIGLTADIVSAYVSNNSVPTADLSGLIAQIHTALSTATNGAGLEPEPQKREPAVSIKKSVQPDFIISLFDGKKYKSLKRHLRTSHDMTPEQYRAHWGLPHDYPMVAPNYAKARSELAKSMGLGQKRKASGKRAKKAR